MARLDGNGRNSVGSSDRPVFQHEAGNPSKVAPISRNQDQLIGQGGRGDLPILRANSNQAKLSK